MTLAPWVGGDLLRSSATVTLLSAADTMHCVTNRSLRTFPGKTTMTPRSVAKTPTSCSVHATVVK